MLNLRAAEQLSNRLGRAFSRAVEWRPELPSKARCIVFASSDSISVPFHMLYAGYFKHRRAELNGRL